MSTAASFLNLLKSKIIVIMLSIYPIQIACSYYSFLSFPVAMQ